MRRGPVAIRVGAGALLLAYLLLVAIVLLGDPSVPTSVIERVRAELVAQGAPAWATYGSRVQMILNALMFAPITALASVAFPWHPWSAWVAYAFIGSGAAEVVQAFALEPRAAEYVDVVANTLGGLWGALAAWPVAWALRRSGARKSGEQP